MKINNFHLSWCLNIYAGESWQEIESNTLVNAPDVFKRLSKHAQAANNLKADGLGLGLRLSALAVDELHGNTESFKQALQRENLYAFTVNAFPYGNFYISPVKEKVYYPDWSSKLRVEYTCKTADILADLLPTGVQGSISTVPVTYGKKLPAEAIQNILTVARHLQSIEKERGKRICLALEPEPDCYLETSTETIEFFQLLTTQDKELTEKYVGVCLDTCHMALQFEDPLESLEKLNSAGILINKIQVSSALCYNPSKAPLSVLDKFNEEVYLHQTIIKDKDGKLHRFPDLGDAIKANLSGEWRIHFHVPLPFHSDEQLSSTSHLLTPEFFKRASELCAHMETETYTYSILPGNAAPVNESITDEFMFVLEKIATNK